MTTRARAGGIALVSFAVLGAPERAQLAPEGADVSPPKATGPQEVEVVAVLMDQRTQQPTVLLQGKRDKRSLAMTIGLAGATGIAMPPHGAPPLRPVTNDPCFTFFVRLRGAVPREVCTDLANDT